LEFNNILVDKTKIINEYINSDKNIRNDFNNFKNSNDFLKIKKNGEYQKSKRINKNISITLYWNSIPIIIFLILLLYYITILFYDNTWDMSDTIILCFVIFSYTIEFLLYFGIIDKYQYISDQEIHNILFETISDNIIKNPVTKNGIETKKKLDLVIDNFIQKSGNINDVLNYYKNNKSNFGDIDEGTVVFYAQSKFQSKFKSNSNNGYDYIDLNILSNLNFK